MTTEQGFIDYMRKERNDFGTTITKYFPKEKRPQDSKELQMWADIRVAAENILIAYDQMRKRLSASSPSPEGGGEDEKVISTEEICNSCAKALLHVYKRDGCTSFIKVNLNVNDTNEHYEMLFTKTYPI